MDVCLLKDLYERLDIPLGTLLWKACESIPCGFVRPHTVRNGRFIFVGGGYTGNSQHSRTVFQYDLTTFIWSALAITPCHSFGLTIINDKVAILGGVNVVTSQETKTLYSYDSSGCKWCESLPPMLNIRSCHSVVNVSNNFIIVAGGIDNISRIHKDSVEILDIQNKQWFEAPPLPIGVSFMCMAASDKSVFLCGGLGESGAVCDLIMADVQTLVESAKSGVSGSAALMEAFRQMATQEGFEHIINFRWAGDGMEAVTRIEVPDWATEIGHSPRGSRVHLHGTSRA